MFASLIAAMLGCSGFSHSVDLDGDGYFTSGDGPLDCDDSDASVHPGAVDWIADEIDQDCDGFELCYQDNDGDLYGSDLVVLSSEIDCVDTGVARQDGDCDDSDSTSNSEGIELCGDDVDQDCDGVLDNGCESIGCSEYDFASISKGIEYAQLNEMPSIDICSGTYDENVSVDVWRSLELRHLKRGDGNIEIYGSFRIDVLDGHTGIEIALPEIYAYCVQSIYNDGLWISVEESGVDIDVAYLYVSGCDTGIYIDGGGWGGSPAPEYINIDFHGGAFVDNGNGATIAVANADIRFYEFLFEGNFGDGAARFAHYNSAYGEYRNSISFFDSIFRFNETDGAGSALSLTSRFDVLFYNSSITDNISNMKPNSGASGALYFENSDDSGSIVTMIGGEVLRNSVFEGDKAGGTFLYSGTLIYRGVDWGDDGSADDNTPTDLSIGRYILVEMSDDVTCAVDGCVFY